MDSSDAAPGPPERDLLITAVETNDRHGAGILLQRLFPDTSSFVHLRTLSLYGGHTTVAGSHHELCSRFLTLAETEEHLARIFGLYRIRRILCVPYYREEFVHAVLAKRLTGAPLCTYLMDDQNVFANEVPDRWVAHLLAASDLRLGISPELCVAYERKYAVRPDLLPPVVDAAPALVPNYWQAEPDEPLRAAMLGNVWTPRAFRRLRELLRITRLRIDWYGNGSKATWLEDGPEEWEADGLRCMGHLPEPDLVAALASYPFVTVPSGTLAADDDNPAFSRLSLPSRLLFCHARTDTPVLVLGDQETAAGRFVVRLGTGLCSPYEAGALRSATVRLTDPAERTRLRAAIRRASPRLVLPGSGSWIWSSLEARSPQPAPFHELFRSETPSPPWVDEVIPARLTALPALPAPGAAFGDEALPAFAILREAHHALLLNEGFALPPPEETELTSIAAAAATFLLSRLVPRETDILFLGRSLPAELDRLRPAARIWTIADLAGWQRNGYAGDPRWLEGPECYPGTFPQFDAFVSTGWLGELPEDPHALEGLSLYLDACGRPGALHLHIIAAVRHPAHFWCPPALDYFLRRFAPHAAAPSRDDVLGTVDAFTLSEAVYDRTWRLATGRAKGDFGHPLGLLLHWRKEDRA